MRLRANGKKFMRACIRTKSVTLADACCNIICCAQMITKHAESISNLAFKLFERLERVRTPVYWRRLGGCVRTKKVSNCKCFGFTLSQRVSNVIWQFRKKSIFRNIHFYCSNIHFRSCNIHFHPRKRLFFFWTF